MWRLTVWSRWSNWQSTVEFDFISIDSLHSRNSLQKRTIASHATINIVNFSSIHFYNFCRSSKVGRGRTGSYEYIRYFVCDRFCGIKYFKSVSTLLLMKIINFRFISILFMNYCIWVPLDHTVWQLLHQYNLPFQSLSR